MQGQKSPGLRHLGKPPTSKGPWCVKPVRGQEEPTQRSRWPSWGPAHSLWPTLRISPRNGPCWKGDTWYNYLSISHQNILHKWRNLAAFPSILRHQTLYSTFMNTDPLRCRDVRVCLEPNQTLYCRTQFMRGFTLVVVEVENRLPKHTQKASYSHDLNVMFSKPWALNQPVAMSKALIKHSQ